MWSGEVAGRSRKEREEWWCEGIDEAMPPFIGERVPEALRRTRQGRGVSGGLAS
jgi:hypothetical protein